MENQDEKDKATISRTDLTKEIIEYLSKEIETVTNGMMVYRSRVSFAVFGAPFLILGTLAYAFKGLNISRELHYLDWIAVGIIAFCYLALAFLSGRIEEDGWRQCNQWRKLISEFQKDPNATILNERNVRQDADGVDPVNWMKLSYLVAGIFLIISFGSLLFILSRVQSTPTSEPQTTNNVLIQGIDSKQ
jgi:hypothetical protein